MEYISDIAVLKRDVQQMAIVLIRLETTIDKVGELANGVTKMLAVHDEKIHTNTDASGDLYTLVEQRRVELHRDLQELNAKLSSSSKNQADAMIETEKRLITAIETIGKYVKTENEILEKRVAALEKWRWILIGGGATIGYLLTQITPMLLKIFGV
jgi:hypothetical protein